MMSPDIAVLDRQRCERRSKCNRGLPGWSNGPASEGRRLTGLELEARAHELGTVVSEPRKESPKGATQQILGQPLTPKPSRRQLPAWLKIRMRAQRRLFDIDRPERAADYPPGTGPTIEAARDDRP